MDQNIRFALRGEIRDALRGHFAATKPLERPDELNLKWRQDAFDVGAALAAVRDAGVQVADLDLKRNVPERVEQLRCSLRRLGLTDDHSVPPAIVSLADREGVLEWEWKA